MVENEKLTSWIADYYDDEVIIEEDTDRFYCKLVDESIYTKIDILKLEVVD